MSIYRRKSGRYAVLVDLESSATGLRRRKSVGTFRTRKEAEAAERKALDARDRGIDLSPKTVTVTQLLDRFIADRRTKGRALRTVMRYDELAKFTIAPHIGGLALAKLSPAHISSWLGTIKERGSAEKKPLSPKSVRHAFSLLRSALRWAMRHELAWRNVADAVDVPTAPRSQARALDENEAARFFAAADATRWGPFFRLALGTGARRGELLALRWDDVMLPEVGQAALTVRHAFVEGKGEDSRIIEKGTKTDRVRTIPLSALAIGALQSQWATQAQERRDVGAAYVDTGHVFQTALGGPVAPFLATEAFRSLRARSKVKATLHDLRHTAATWMLAAGVDVASVARILGHATPTTTLSIYAHALPAAESRAIRAIDERLSGAQRGA
jgi:integrase